MKKTKMLVGLLAIATLVGCGGTSTTDKKTEAPAQTTTAQATTNAPAQTTTEAVAETTTEEVAADGKKTYVFEAEYNPDIEDRRSPDFSGTRMGLELIGSEQTLGDARWDCSNGYFVYPLAIQNEYLTFEIESDKDVNDATLIWRISSYCYNISLEPGFYDIYIGEEQLQYEKINITEVPGYSTGLKKFEDYTLTTSLSLKKGTNYITFYTSNAVNPGGTTSTYQATAPCFDCFKIITDANLTWPTECKDNTKYL